MRVRDMDPATLRAVAAELHASARRAAAFAAFLEEDGAPELAAKAAGAAHRLTIEARHLTRWANLASRKAPPRCAG